MYKIKIYSILTDASLMEPFNVNAHFTLIITYHDPQNKIQECYNYNYRIILFAAMELTTYGKWTICSEY